MTKIYHPRKPIRIDTELDNYRHRSTPEGKALLLDTYEGVYDAIQAAWFIAINLFEEFGFENRTMLLEVEDVTQTILHDTLVVEHLLNIEEADSVIAVMKNIVTDIYVAILEYARHLIKAGHGNIGLIDLLHDTHYEIIPIDGDDVDMSDEIAFVIKQSRTVFA